MAVTESSSRIEAVVVPGQLIPREIIDRDDVEAVTQALRDGADPNAVYDKFMLHPLHVATAMRARRVVQLLVDNGADVNAASKYGETPLIGTATNNEPALAELLIRNGADPNRADTVGNTALMRAAYLGLIEVATVLLKGGADANAQKPSGETALSEAVKRGHVDIVNLLLTRGARVDQAAIDAAQQKGDGTIVTLLESHNSASAITPAG